MYAMVSEMIKRHLPRLDHEFFDCIPDSLDLAVELIRLIRRNACRNNRSCHVTSTAKRSLARHIDIWHVL